MIKFNDLRYQKLCLRLAFLNIWTQFYISMSVNGDYIGATHLTQVLSFRSRIDKKVKVAARTAANLSQEPGNIDPLTQSIDPLDMVSLKLGGSEYVDLKMSRSIFLPDGPKTSRTLNNFP